MAAGDPNGPRRFPTTSWSLVVLAADVGPEEQRQALERLLTVYLPALRAHLIYSKRLAPEAADDLLQDFVAAKILQRDLLARADQQLGRFRTFLLTALDRYWLNRLRDQGVQKRAADAAVPLGDHDQRLTDGHHDGDAYNVAWAKNLLAQSIEQMQAECEASGRGEFWGLFECRVLQPILEGAAPIGYDELIERFGFRSPSHAANALVTAKRMFARILRCVVSEYVADDGEIEEELADLRRILAHESR